MKITELKQQFHAERLWNDIRSMVRKRIETRDTLVRTKAQGRKFWLVRVTDATVRVTRERSSLPHEDIPKGDFVDIWEDLNKVEYQSIGYAQRNLHDGQNRHSALSLALVGMLPYVRWERVGKAWKLFPEV